MLLIPTSPNFIYGIVLAAALLHAIWNALIKRSTDTWLSAISIAAVGALMAAAILPWLTQPAAASWPFIAASLTLQVMYMRLVAHVYRLYDMSFSYPIMRGTAPLIVAAVSLVLFPERLGLGVLLGIATLCLGIFCIGLQSGSPPAARSGLKASLLTAIIIASYTLVDGMGVRLSGAPASYTLWIFLFQGLVMIVMAHYSRPGVLWTYLTAHWKLALIGGFGSIASYGAALWAMTLAPIALIAALRETSILFGILISGLFLRERITPGRILGAIIVVAGTMMLRLASGK